MAEEEKTASSHVLKERPPQLVQMPHWGSFHTPKGYDYLRCRQGQTVGYWVCRFFLDIAAYLATRIFLGLKIQGRRNLRKLKGGFVTIANHVQDIDCGMVLQALWGHRVYFVSIEENFALAGVGHILRWAGAVPFPERLDLLAEHIEAMGRALKQRSVVHVYPEGVLLPYHQGVGPFGSGAFHLAVANHVPIVPLAIRQRARKGLWRILKRRPCFTLEILPPLYPDPALGRHAAADDLLERSWQAMDAALA